MVRGGEQGPPVSILATPFDPPEAKVLRSREEHSMAHVGVVVPLYNKADYIERCLRSIVAQTFDDFEVVVVDDGSHDESPKMVETFGDPRIRLVQQENAGPGGARNRGIDELNTSLIAFLDADDTWHPDHLATALQNLEQHPGCVLSCCGQHVIKPNVAEPVDVTPMYRRGGVTPGEWRPTPTISARRFKIALDFLHSDAIVCQREVVERYGGYYAKGKCRYGEDTWIWLQVALNHTVYRDLRPLVCVDWVGSDLSMGNPAPKPIRPFLTDPDPIFKVTPKVLKPTVDRLFAYYALERAMSLSKLGQPQEARDLMAKYPLTKCWHPDFLGRRLRRAVGRLLGR